MSESQGPIEIAEAPTQFEAEAIAEVVRAEGIEAAVYGGGAMPGVAERWVVMVSRAEASRARMAIVESRVGTVPLAVLEECPWCGYSLVGITSTERCPECGTGLDLTQVASRTRGIIKSERTPALSHGAAVVWLWVGVGLCAIIGLVGYIPLRGWLPTSTMWSSFLLGLTVFVIALVVRRKARQARRQRRAGTQKE